MSLIALPFGLAARSSVIDCGFHSHQPITKGSDHDFLTQPRNNRHRLPSLQQETEVDDWKAQARSRSDLSSLPQGNQGRSRADQERSQQPSEKPERARESARQTAIADQSRRTNGWRHIEFPELFSRNPRFFCAAQVGPSYSRREREDEGSSKPQRIGAGKYKEVPRSIIALERESNRPVVAADVGCATCGPSWQPSARLRRGIAAWKFDSINHSSGLLRLFLDREICRHQLRPDQPPVVRAQITARNSAVSGPLDCWAALYGDGAMTIDPLVHGRWCYTKHIGQCFLATKGSTGFFDSVHFRNYSFATDKLQAMLYASFDSVAI